MLLAKFIKNINKELLVFGRQIPIDMSNQESIVNSQFSPGFDTFFLTE